MTENELNRADSGKAMWFAGGALAVAAAIALFLYADGYFDRSDSIELKIHIPQVEVQPI